NERGVAPRPVDPLEERVAVRAVDDRVVLRAKGNGVTDVSEGEFRRGRVAMDLNAFEFSAKRAFGRQDAGDAVEDTQVRVVESERAVERRLSRLARVPGTERTLRHDFAGRHRVGQRRLEWHR